MKTYLLFLSILMFTSLAIAQKDPIEKTWYNKEKSSKIQIYKATDGKFYGKIVWLKITHDEKGEPRKDKHNSDIDAKQQPLNGLLIIKGFSRAENSIIYEDGTIYDPNSGKKYCGKITFKETELALKGFICGISLLGKTSTWTLAE